MKETTYNRILITVLSLIIVTFLFIFGFIFIQDEKIAACIISFASSLLSSFVFFFIFLNFENSMRNEKYYKRIGLNKSFEREYWIDLIKHLNNTKEDVIFYGNSLSRWLDESDYISELINRIKSKEEGKVYFILHNEEYFHKWKEILPPTKVKTIKKDGAAPYSAVCVGNRINVVIHPSGYPSDNSLTIEIERESTMGRQYINYLNECIKYQT